MGKFVRALHGCCTLRSSLPSVYTHPSIFCSLDLTKGDRILVTMPFRSVWQIVNRTLTTKSSARAFTLVEVMMATVIMMVGFIGMMEAVAISAATMEHARRQTFATQVMSHEIDDLYFLPWSGTNSISNLATASTAVAIDTQFWPNWNGATNYTANRVVAYSIPSASPPVANGYYRCILAHANQPPCNSTGAVNATYWTAVTTGQTTDIVVFSGATFTLARTVTSPDPVTNIRQVNFTMTWAVTTGRIGSAVSQGGRTAATAADDYSTNLRQSNTTHTRVMSAWYGKYGLPLSYQRS